MPYPTMLLVAAILLVLGLGIYQRLSASVEMEVADVEGGGHPKPIKRGKPT
jgi:hypothetical protein